MIDIPLSAEGHDGEDALRVQDRIDGDGDLLLRLTIDGVVRTLYLSKEGRRKLLNHIAKLDGLTVGPLIPSAGSIPVKPLDPNTFATIRSTSNDNVASALLEVAAAIREIGTPSAAQADPALPTVKPDARPYATAPDFSKTEETRDEWNERALQYAIEEKLTAAFVYTRPAVSRHPAWDARSKRVRVAPAKLESIGPTHSRYVVIEGYDHERRGNQTFRLDRITGPVIVEHPIEI